MSAAAPAPAPTPAYAELAAATSFSFLRGASQPGDMVGQALHLGHSAIGIADRNTVAGVVRAKIALKLARERAVEKGLEPPDFRLVVGARLVFVDGTPDMLAYPVTRRGWGRLTSLLTRGNLRAEKGECILRLDDLLLHLEEMQIILLPENSGEAQRARKQTPDHFVAAMEAPAPPALSLVAKQDPEGILARLAAQAPGAVWLGAVLPRQGDDARRLARLKRIARGAGVPLIALNDALYATPDHRPLHDVITAIRLKTTVQAAGRHLAANAERHLKSPVEMARLFAACPEAIGETQRFIAGIHFTLDDLAYEYPHEPVPYGWAPQDWLEHLVMEAAHERYGVELSEKVRTKLDEEFTLIRGENYAYYFLTVHDLVRFARTREPPILCQGRGSAANSIVCFLLGVTSVDPVAHDLLFTRFMSPERKEPPDIDVDFEHERREEVMQYIYKRYGRHRAGIAATVIHYRPRSAVREVGKALGLSEDVTARLGSTVWGSYASGYERERVEESGLDPDNPQIARLNHFVQHLLDYPRHLSQHVGGFVLTQDRLDETVPLHNAAMDGRTFIEWDKDDIDALGIMKVDVLALGMLTCIRKSFDLLRHHGLGDYRLDAKDLESTDDAVYDMLCKGDSIGVFQVESRAQMNMLPRLRPRKLYDLVVQVAIVRPGPIEGEMVHPYLRRRCGEEKWSFPSPAPHYPQNELHDLLENTYGVPLFQEQAMKLAIVAAAFTPAEANQLRRAMATFRNVGTIDQLRDKMVGGMVRRGYEQEFAERCFKQIEGFGSYGFPESHAQSFARLVYVSAWIKCHHPAVFACALLNSQPMGFYAPAQIVRDAQEHGVTVRAADINASGWDNRLEPVAVMAAPCGMGHDPREAEAFGSDHYPDGGRQGDGRKDSQWEDGPREVRPGRAGTAGRSASQPMPAPPAHQESLAGQVMPAHQGMSPPQAMLSPQAKPPHQVTLTRQTMPVPPNAMPASPQPLALRLGLRQISGFKQDWADHIAAAAPFASIEDLARRARLPARALHLLADADAMRSLGLDRRQALWEARRTPVGELPLFAAARARELGEEPAVALPATRLGEHVAADYQTMRLSLKAHPMALLRPHFTAAGAMPCAQLRETKADARVRLGGVVLVRQRPGKGNAIFVTLEDEDAIANVVIWARLFERYRREIMSARLMIVEGVLQRSREGVLHVMANRIIDRSDLLARLDEAEAMPTSQGLAPTAPREDAATFRQHRRHPRDVRLLPRSRDFH